MVRFGSRGVQEEKGIWLGLVQGGSGGGRNMVRFGSRGVQGEKGIWLGLVQGGYRGRKEWGRGVYSTYLIYALY